ncbi:MAG: protein-L-isoaspartate(D-aspartate) O-methyltransferase [Phycisphaerae bacterium]
MMANRSPDEEEWARRRARMIAGQIRGRSIHDARVLSALAAVPRERFVPLAVRSSAYDDRALAIGYGQTISQPYIVAYMTWQLDVASDHRVLEVGTGTGYQTAVLARLARHVFSIERIPALHEQACANLAALDTSNVSLHVGDGSAGLPEHAPFHRILVAAAAPQVPHELTDQLVEGGVLIIPVGGPTEQNLVRVVRRAGRTVDTPLLGCRFVKLIGTGGWAPTRNAP